MAQTPRPKYKETFPVGKGVAIVGIWLGTGLSSIWAGSFVIFVAFAAVIATFIVVRKD